MQVAGTRTHLVSGAQSNAIAKASLRRRASGRELRDAVAYRLDLLRRRQQWRRRHCCWHGGGRGGNRLKKLLRCLGRRNRGGHMWRGLPAGNGHRQCGGRRRFWLPCEKNQDAGRRKEKGAEVMSFLRHFWARIRRAPLQRGARMRCLQAWYRRPDFHRNPAGIDVQRGNRTGQVNR